MSKPTPLSTYPEQRLAGLRRHAAHQQQATLLRLRAAIEALEARGEPITVHTIRAESHLDYKSYARNPEALKLFQLHSTYLSAKRKEARKRRKKEAGAEDLPKDPLLNYKRPQHVSGRKSNAVRRSRGSIGNYWKTACKRISKSCNWKQNSPDISSFLMISFTPTARRCWRISRCFTTAWMSRAVL